MFLLTVVVLLSATLSSGCAQWTWKASEGANQTLIWRESPRLTAYTFAAVLLLPAAFCFIGLIVLRMTKREWLKQFVISGVFLFPGLLYLTYNYWSSRQFVIERTAIHSAYRLSPFGQWTTRSIPIPDVTSCKYTVTHIQQRLRKPLTVRGSLPRHTWTIAMVIDNRLGSTLEIPMGSYDYDPTGAPLVDRVVISLRDNTLGLIIGAYNKKVSPRNRDLLKSKMRQVCADKYTEVMAGKVEFR